MKSLSPGERLRAALICLWQRRPVPELLILGEPTNHLDFVGIDTLESVLSAWPGGLVVVSRNTHLVSGSFRERHTVSEERAYSESPTALIS